MQSQLQQSNGMESGLQAIPLTEPLWLKEYADNVDATAGFWNWNWYAPELVAQAFMDCPYLCDDGLLWKPVPREQVVDMATVPLNDGDEEWWLQQEVFVVADSCYYCN